MSVRVPAWLRVRRPRPVPVGADYHILMVCSSGGHLSQLLELRPWWESRTRTWVSFDKPDVVSRLAGERVIWGHHPTTRNIPNLLRNLVLSVRTVVSERPDVIVSDGAGLAVPFFWVGRLFGARTVFLEVYDRIDSATMTGKLVEPVTDLMLVQWPEQARLYRDAVVAGTVW